MSARLLVIIISFVIGSTFTGAAQYFIITSKVENKADKEELQNYRREFQNHKFSDSLNFFYFNLGITRDLKIIKKKLNISPEDEINLLNE